MPVTTPRTRPDRDHGIPETAIEDIEGGRATAPVGREWAYWTAIFLSAATAALHMFILARPTLAALASGDANAESQQGLAMMWHGMSAIMWTYPVALLLVRPMPQETARPVLGFVALLNAAQALFYAGFVVPGYDASVMQLLPQLALHASVAVAAWLARPSRPRQASAPASRKKWRLMLTWTGIVVGAILAGYHFVEGTFYSWPADVLASNTASPAKLELYVMWLFSCVVFAAVPATLFWSLRAPGAPGRFIVRFAAIFIAMLMVSWASSVALGFSDKLPAVGALTLGLLAALTAAGAPPKPR